MSDTFGPFLKTRLQETGAYDDSWGQNLNSDVITLLEHAITGQISINVGSATSYSLAALASGSAADSRYFWLKFTGTPGSALTVTVPSSVTKKQYLVDNQTGQSLTIKYATGTGVTIANGVRQLVVCDATTPEVVTIKTDTALAFARLTKLASETSVINIFDNVANASTYRTLTDAASIALDASQGNKFYVVLGGNRTFANPTNPTDGQGITIVIQQDATGSRTLSWGSAWEWVDSTAPVLKTAANGRDLVYAEYNSTAGKWLAWNISNATSTPGVLDLTISANEVDVNAFVRAGSPAGAVTLNITAAQGVIIQASTTATPALDFTGFASGSIINLVNNGYILGKGGNGGNGGASTQANPSYALGFGLLPHKGFAGGDAIKHPGPGVTFNLNNSSGFIWGGGGGGGGGAISSSNTAGSAASAGGGGGGAGGGKGGDARSVSISAVTSGGTDGAMGSTGPNGVGGAGGSPVSAGADVGYAGGAGGAFGAAGAADASTGIVGGAAGKAINLNGGVMGTFTGSSSPNTKGAVA